MWMREKLESKAGDKLLKLCRVISSGRNLMAVGDINLRSPEVVAPYGYYFLLPVGQTARSCDGRLLGVPMEVPEELEEGEILIKNKFGAEISLNRDGSVVINGQIFERGDG